MYKYSKKLAGACLAAMLLMNGGNLLPADYIPQSAVIAEAAAVDPADASGFVVLSDVIPDIVQEIRYYSTYNFVGDRIRGYEEPVALMTQEAAFALKEVADELRKQGYRLKVYDSYRPQMAVDNFVAWANHLDDKRMKEYFYPQVEKNRLFADGYIDAKSGHSRGSTLDLTLLDMKTGKEVDMGGTFDHFGIESHPDWCGNPETGKYTGKYKGNTPPRQGEINEVQFKNRMVLRNAMLRHGFKPLAEEWWHFTLKNEPYPNTYFTFPSDPAQVKATAKLVSPSPQWVTQLPAAQTAKQMVVVAGVAQQSAWISLHEKDGNGVWQQVMSTPGYIGKNGLGKTKEGDAMTPVGTFHFTKAFGIAPDPGCKLPYMQVDENAYWSGDPDIKYNEMVDIRQYPNLNKEDSEHIVEYYTHYQYCLNISYNESGTPGKGSAIFMHCFGDMKPYTGGCVSLPEAKMKLLMQRVEPGCAVVIDSLEKMGGAF